MKIIYLHHGNRKIKTTPNKDDDLTKLGVHDAKLTRKLLSDKKIAHNLKAIHTSTSFRCKKTAKIINKHLNLPVYEDSRLDEFKTFPNETWFDLQKRTEDCLNDIIKKYQKDDIVICITSGVNIVGFMNKAYNLPPSETAPFLGVPSCSPIIFDYKGE